MTRRPKHMTDVRPAAGVDVERRGFLFVAASLAAGGLLGCEPPARDSRRLPGAAEGLSPSPVLSGEPVLPEAPAVVRVVQRPLPPTSEPIVRVRVATVRPPAQRHVRVEGDGTHVLIGTVDGAMRKQVALPATIESTLDGWLVIESAGSRHAGTYQFP
ncbi:MAG: hypothetical protein SGJ11_01250, partial [Phycisphaerae bacterium]|nr:hypothetical protein [Phycisphaerae bacterium]